MLEDLKKKFCHIFIKNVQVKYEIKLTLRVPTNPYITNSLNIPLDLNYGHVINT